jgi:prepilin-type N-terminal cleavage/methylation domain-containing protein
MRKGLTLIELILSMVIIGIVFTVIPRLIMSMNQAAQTTVKEEAMYNAVALMGAIINLPWDNNNTVNNQILNVTNKNIYDCNTSLPTGGGSLGYRIGGFVGGRDCRALRDGTYDFNASTDFNDSDGLFNDIDDYNTDILNAEKNCSGTTNKKLYSINTFVNYVDDPSVLGTVTLSDNNLSTSSNTKRIIVKVGYHNDNKKGNSDCITALEYHSFNLGNIQINSSNW